MMDSMKNITLMYEPKKDVQGIYRNPNLLNSKLGNAYWGLLRTQGFVGQTQTRNVEQAIAALKPIVEKVNDFFTSKWPAYQKAVEEAKLSPFKPYEKLEVKE